MARPKKLAYEYAAGRNEYRKQFRGPDGKYRLKLTLRIIRGDDDNAPDDRVYYFPSEPRLVLCPCNPLYSDMTYTGPELGNIEIIGEAVAFTSLVRHE